MLLTGQLDDAEKLKEMMKGKILKLQPGCSTIEVDGMLHSFSAEQRNH